jgi:hypothetical protein
MPTITDLETKPFSNLFDEFGTYRKRIIVQDAEIMPTNHEDNLPFVDALDEPLLDDLDDTFDRCIYAANQHLLVHSTTFATSSPRSLAPTEPDYESLRPFFGWLPLDVVQQTFKRTTQYARMPMSTYLKKRYKSPYPALNVHRRNEPVATDTVYSDTPAIVDGGETCAQIF